jgi:hypothetical protein
LAKIKTSFEKKFKMCKSKLEFEIYNVSMIISKLISGFVTNGLIIYFIGSAPEENPVEG